MLKLHGNLFEVRCYTRQNIQDKKGQVCSFEEFSQQEKSLGKKKLIVSSDSSSTEISPIEETAAAPLPKNLDYAEERMKSVKEELKNNPDSRPINIDVAMKQEDQHLFTTEDTLKVEGPGEGQWVKSENVKAKKRKKRSKTARSNRVSPSVSDTRHCKSEASIKPEEPCSSPDPLEPWSTKSITNMNAILAWEQDNSI